VLKVWCPECHLIGRFSHWGCAFGGDCGVPLSSSFFPFCVPAMKQTALLHHALPLWCAASTRSQKAVSSQSWSLQNCEPKYIFSLYKLISSGVCYSNRNLTATYSIVEDNMILSISSWQWFDLLLRLLWKFLLKILCWHTFSFLFSK
jgi:hypothetical protein